MKINYLAILLAGAMLFASCKKDKEESPSINSAETDKAAIEDNAVEVANSLKAFAADPGVKASGNLGNLTSKDDVSTLKSLKSLSVLKSFAEGKMDLKSVASELKIGAITTSEEDFNNAKGVYTWNSSTSMWDEAVNSSATSIQFKFPSTSTGTTNDATFEITTFDFDYITLDGEQVEQPVDIDATLKVGSSAVLTYAFTATYSNDRPTSVSTTLTIGEFSMSFNASNTNTAANTDYSFKQGSQTIIGYGASAIGNWTESNVTAATTTPDEVNIGMIVTSATVYYTFFNIKLSVSSNVKNLYDKIEANPDMELSEGVALINSNVTGKIAYTNGNLIANSNFYVGERVDTVYSYDPYTYMPTTDTETVSTLEMQFIFADGSKVALETYFEESMKEFETAINGLVKDLNTEYSELDMKPIEMSTK